MVVASDVVVVPLKAFGVAKHRLRRGGVRGVSELAHDLALGVIEGCAPRHVIVLSESSAVSRFALEHGAEALESDAADLNGAVQRAYATLGSRYDQLIIAHGDLRYPSGLGTFSPEVGVTVFADHLGTGTNVMVVPTRLDFRFAYGEHSAQRHHREAQRLGVACRVITDSPWRFDVDEPGDVNLP
jgi:2-phospho-L-lactate guanylyltransferase (CobY/MobA/RfbA family)